jgi:hypothetical protein
MRSQFHVFNRKVGVTWLPLLQVELTLATFNKSSVQGDTGRMLDRRQRRRSRYPGSTPLPGGRQRNPAPKAASFGFVQKCAPKALLAALLGSAAHDLPRDGAIYGQADFTSNMPDRGFVQKLPISLGTEVKILAGTAHLLHLLQQQIKILLPIRKI